MALAATAEDAIAIALARATCDRPAICTCLEPEGMLWPGGEGCKMYWTSSAARTAIAGSHADFPAHRGRARSRDAQHGAQIQSLPASAPPKSALTVCSVEDIW